MHLSRAKFASAAAGASVTAVMRFPAGAAEFTYKLGTDVPPEHPVAAHSILAAAKVTQQSAGQLEIRVFPNGQLGGQPQQVTQAREGALEFLMISDNVMAAIVPVAAMSGVPFAFPGYKEAWAAMDGPLGKYVRGAIAGANLGLRTFEFVWDAGFRQMVNSVRPINVPDDLRGLKMRIPPAPMPVAMFKAYGASSAAVSPSEMYTAMQTHLVDGLDNPLVSIESNKLYEVQKYIAMTSHVWTDYQLHANIGTWQKLPQKLRDLCDKVFNDEAVIERNEVARSDATLEPKLKSQGMIFNRPAIAPFKAVLQAAGLYAEWQKTFGTAAWSALEQTVGKLT